MPNIHEKYIQLIREGYPHAPTSHFSNTMRKKDYVSNSQSTRELRRVLEIDVNQKMAWVEPNVSMEKLVSSTLHYDLIPRVVPEFKGITVGGAINGAAIESSSHLYGQFNDTCTSYEIMIGDGNIMWADEKENSDLFYGIASSYGSLGTLLSAKIKLMPSMPYVRVHYEHFSSITDALTYLQQQHEREKPPEFLEAIAYDKNHIVTIIGHLTEERNAPILSLSEYWSPWFYSHAKTAKGDENIKIKEYLFRHDRGAFWMGGFAPDIRMSFSYFLHKVSQFLGRQKDLSVLLFPLQRTPKDPGILFRSLFGWLMDSQKLYASLHSGSEKWFEEKFVIQDFYLPFLTANSFTEYVLSKYKISPIWICPVLSTTTPQFFSPHFRQSQELLFDIGVYGIPAHTAGPKAVRDLELLNQHLDGKKMFYCHTYFSEEDFWKIYPFKKYNDLRAKYKLENTVEITKKILI